MAGEGKCEPGNEENKEKKAKAKKEERQGVKGVEKQPFKAAHF